MASNRALLRFTVALAVLAALLCLSESTNWLAKSSEPETPQWRFVELPAEHRAFPDGHDITSKTRMEAIRRQEHGEDEYGPLKITDTLVLKRPMEGLGEYQLLSRISFGSLRSLIVPSDVNLDHFASIIKRVLAESSLDELEILHPKFDFDLSHQLAVKRVAIDSSMIDSLPQLPHLDELVLKNIHEGDLPRLQRFHQVSRLTLTGDVVVVSQVNASTFNRLSSLEVHVSDHESSDQRRGVRFESSIQATAISFQTNATTTNASLSTDLCGMYSTGIATLYLSCTDTLPTWFQVPACISNWSTLTTMTVRDCMLPNLTTLPTSLTALTLRGFLGPVVTQAEIGTDTGIYGGYFDWQWLRSLPQLSLLTLSDGKINGTLPNHLSHANMATLTLSDLGLVGTISPNFFLQFAKTSAFYATTNSLTGTIPYYGLAKLIILGLAENQFTHWPPLIINATTGFGAPSLLSNLILQTNKLVQIPNESDFQLMNRLTSFWINDNPTLIAPLPDVYKTATARSASNLLFLYSANNVGFTGTIPEVPAYQVPLYSSSSTSFNFRCRNCNLTGTLPQSWKDIAMSQIDFGEVNGIGGTLATIDPSTGQVLSQAFKSVLDLTLSSPGFTGPMFNVTAAGTQYLNVTAPNLDLCASIRLSPSNPTSSYASNYMGLCDLSGTNGSTCIGAYPAICGASATPWAAPTSPPVTPITPPTTPPTTPVTPPTTPPVTEPITPPVSPPMAEPITPIAEPTAPVDEPTAPTTVPVAPTPEPIVVAGKCPMPSPGPSFVCEGNTWVSHDSVTEQTITLPPASTTTINGNLTTTSIVITSASSSINVTGCVTTSDGKTPMITIVLTQSDLEELVKSGGKVTTEVVHQGRGCAAISSSSLNVDSSGIKSCKSVSTDKIGTGSGLAATFTVHTSKCNVWWIVLVSVLCGAVIIALVVTIIVWRLCKTSSMKRERSRLG